MPPSHRAFAASRLGAMPPALAHGLATHGGSLGSAAALRIGN